MLRPLFEAYPEWVELMKRLPAAGLLPDDAELIARLAGTRAVSEPSEASPPPARGPVEESSSGWPLEERPVEERPPQDATARIPHSPGPPAG
jgi:hypothetical protein